MVMIMQSKLEQRAGPGDSRSTMSFLRSERGKPTSVRFTEPRPRGRAKEGEDRTEGLGRLGPPRAVQEAGERTWGFSISPDLNGLAVFAAT